MTPGIERTFKITAVMILVIQLIIFNIGNLQLKLLTKDSFFNGLPINAITVSTAILILVASAEDFQK